MYAGRCRLYGGYTMPLFKPRFNNIFTFGDLFTLSALGIMLFSSYKNASIYQILVVVSCVLLGTSISTAVHNAEVIAKRIGPSLGTLVLALSVTVIEVVFIINMMRQSSASAPTIARDTVFAALMILTNGVVGVSIWLGGLKHKELGFQTVGTSSLMGVLVTLTVLTMVLPNYTVSTTGPTFTSSQLIFVSIASIMIYLSLIWAQTKSHKSYFASLTQNEYLLLEKKKYVPSRLQATLSFVRLLFSLVAVIGLAKILSPTIEEGLRVFNAPPSFIGIVIALLVLAPETLSALNAAKANQLQTTLNLALGSGAASIALTVPAVSAYSLWTQQPILLGLDPKNTVFLVLTFIAGGFTFGAGRATTLHGVVHIVILMSYVLLSLIP